MAEARAGPGPSRNRSRDGECRGSASAQSPGPTITPISLPTWSWEAGRFRPSGEVVEPRRQRRFRRKDLHPPGLDEGPGRTETHERRSHGRRIEAGLAAGPGRLAGRGSCASRTRSDTPARSPAADSSSPVVAPGPFWYSGLATGMLGGAYSPEDDQIDVARLVERGGGRFIHDRVRTVDPSECTVTLESGTALRYDVVSLNLGSEVPTWTIPGLARWAIAVKPIENLHRLRAEVMSRLAWRPRNIRCGSSSSAGARPPARWPPIFAAWSNGRGLARRSRLLVRGDRLMRSWPERAWAIMSDSLRGRGVTVRHGSPAVQVDEGAVFTAGGDPRLPTTCSSPPTDLVASPLIATTGLPTDPWSASWSTSTSARRRPERLRRR